MTICIIFILVPSPHELTRTVDILLDGIFPLNVY